MVDKKQNTIKEAEEVVIVNEDSTLNAVSQSIESNTELAKDSLNRIQTLSKDVQEQVLQERDNVLEAERENLRLKGQLQELENEQSRVQVLVQSNYGTTIYTTDDLDDVKEEIKKGYATKIERLNTQVAALKVENKELLEEKMSVVRSYRSEIQTLKSENQDKLRAAEVEKELLAKQHKRQLDTIAEEQRREIENLRMATRKEQHHHNMQLKQLLLDFNHRVKSVRIGLAARLLGFKNFVKEWQFDLESKQWRYLASI